MEIRVSSQEELCDLMCLNKLPKERRTNKGMELKALICTCCGGQIDRPTLTCKMCGTAFMLDKNDAPAPIEIKLTRENVHTLACAEYIPREMLVRDDAEEYTEYVLRKMARSIADKLLPYIEHESIYDPKTQTVNTYGRLRVIKPN